MWAQQGWLAPLPSQGWWVKGADGETEARPGHGAAREQHRTLGSLWPIRCLGSVSGGCGKVKCCKSLKIKGAVGWGCARACPHPAPRGSLEDLAANPAVHGRILALRPGNARIQRAGDCPPSLSSLCHPVSDEGGPCRFGDMGAKLRCRWLGWVSPWWYPEEFQRGAELEELWGHCPRAPQHTRGSGETEAEPARVTLHEALGLWCHLWGVRCPPRTCRAEGGTAEPVAAVCPAGKVAGRRGLAGHQTPGDLALCHSSAAALGPVLGVPFGG